jgi:hypothetical protein
MATLYTRAFDLKDSLSDQEVLDFWKTCMNELLPAIRGMDGSIAARAFSGAGALRADLTLTWIMEDAAVYEKALHDPQLRDLIGQLYAAIDLRTSEQSFRREITPELIQAIGG